MNIKVLGIDLAKNVFQLYGVHEVGKTVLTKKLTRAKLMGVSINRSTQNILLSI